MADSAQRIAGKDKHPECDNGCTTMWVGALTPIHIHHEDKFQTFAVITNINE